MNHHLLACSKCLPIAARVVLWDHPLGFNAYAEHRLSSPGILPNNPASAACNVPRRYGRRSYCSAAGNFAQLQRGLRYVVFHHSVTRTARECFAILHDRRGLSVHLIVDEDGTIYQTLDLRERDRGGGGINNWGVNVEIANLACAKTFPNAYKHRGQTIGRIHGILRYQWRYTPQQIESCQAIAATLCIAFPGIAPLAPVTATTVLANPLNQRSYGILGHYHVDRRRRKWDPGPAFPWLKVQSVAAQATFRTLDLSVPIGKQRALQCAGYHLPQWGADGSFGPESRRALDILRSDAGLEPGGWDADVEAHIRAQVTP